MPLLLTLLCLIGTTLSTTPYEPAHQGHEEPKVAIDGYVNGYYTFLGHQFPVFFDKAHTAIHGIETANKQTGSHSTYPHIESDPEAIAESSLVSNHQQDDISMSSVAFAHQQKSPKHNSHELSSILGSSESDIEVFGHGHIHLNPISEKNIKEAFYIENSHAGRFMETEKLDSMRNIGSTNSHQTNVYSATSSPIQGIPGLRVYPRGGFSQNNEDAFGTTGNQEAGETHSSIGLDRNVYTENQNSFTRRAMNADLSKLNQANFGKRTMTQRGRSNVVPYVPYDRTVQVSNYNSGLNQNQVISRNQNIGQTSYKDYSRISSPNQASGGVVTQEEVETKFSNHPTFYTNQLGHTNSAWSSEGDTQLNVNPIADSIEQVFSDGRSINHRAGSVRNTGITDQNLYTSGSRNRGLVNSDRGVVAQKETKRFVVTHPNFDHIEQTGYPNSFLDGEQDIVSHYDHGFLLDMSQINNRNGAMTQKKTLTLYPNYDSQINVHNRNGKVDEAGYRASEVLNHEERHSNAALSENGGIHDGNVYFGGMSYDGRDEINHEMGTINQQKNQETFVSNPESSRAAKMSRNQNNANKNLHIKNENNGYTQRGQMSPEAAEFPDISSAESVNGGLGHDFSSCDQNHHHMVSPLLDFSGNIVGKVGQETLSLNPIVEQNFREVFTERKLHQGDGIHEEPTGVQTNYGGRDQFENPNQINNQIIHRNVAGFESLKGKGYHGKDEVYSERGASYPRVIQNTVPKYETMGGSNIYRGIRNRNLYTGKAESIPQVRPTEAAAAQGGIEIPGADSRPVNQNQYLGNRVYGVDQVNSERGQFSKIQTGKSNSDFSGIGRISDNLGLTMGITDQPGYGTSPRINQANTGEDTSSQKRTSETIISFPIYGRIKGRKISTDSGVNQNQNQPEYRVLPNNNAVHGFNTGYYPLSDSNGEMFFQSGSYGQYPIQDKLSGQIPLWGKLDYPLENRPTGEHIPKFRSNIHYPPQSGLNDEYYSQNINLQYPSQLGLNGLYHRQGQNPPMDIQYPSQGGLNVQYSLLYGQYGQYPIENESYLNSMLDEELSRGSQGLTPLSSRSKENESDHDGTIVNVEPDAEVTDKETFRLETQTRDAKSESGNDNKEAEPKIDAINKATSDKRVSSSIQLPSVPQIMNGGEPSESKNENLKFQTKETTQVGDSQTIKFTIRLPPKMITRKSITNLEKHTEKNEILDEHSKKTQQQVGKKGIQVIIDSPSLASNQGGGGGSRVMDLPPRFGIQESNKSVDSSQRSEHIAEIGTSMSSGSTLGLGDETGTDRRNEDDGQKEGTKVQIRNISSEHSESEEIKSDLGTPQNESKKVQVNSRDSGEIRDIRVDSASELNGSDKYQGPLVSSSDNEGKLGAHSEDFIGIGVNEETNESGVAKTTAEASNGNSVHNEGRYSAHVLNRHNRGTGGIDEHIRKSDERGEVQVPAGGFDSLFTNKELVYSNEGNGGVLENIMRLSRRNTDSAYGVGLKSILDNGNDKGLGVHIKYKGPDVYATGNSNSWEDNEIAEKPGDQSINKQKVKLSHHGHFQPELDLARNLV